MNFERLRARVALHEGLRLKPYRDTVGKLTIGYGRNLDDVGISKEEAHILLQNDLEWAIEDAERNIPHFSSMNGIRQEVMVEMLFNIGLTKLRQFKLMFRALEDKNYDRAADEMIDSKWYVQVGVRAVELVKLMRTGMSQDERGLQV